MQLSVIICAHNPRRDYLERVLDGLKAQTLPVNEWQLLLIDNASDEPLADAWDLSWHPNAQHVREATLGLIPARVRGIRETTADLLVFVDDDNVLEVNYLERAITIGEIWSILGVWGGQLIAEFEGGEPREVWKRDFWTLRLVRDIWSNNYDRFAVPNGAGICIRRAVAMKYVECVTPDSLRSKLGRSGSALNSSEDVDMAFTACDLGFGTGKFVALSLTHLIPKSRLSDDYLFCLIERIAYSEAIVLAVRGDPPTKMSRVDRLVELYKNLRMDELQRRTARARALGRTRALNAWHAARQNVAPRASLIAE
jgi:glycosyltransferase involved in cell wall biosynthesis